MTKDATDYKFVILVQWAYNGAIDPIGFVDTEDEAKAFVDKDNSESPIAKLGLSHATYKKVCKIK